MSDIVLLYCTTASVAEAEKVAEAVVSQRLAACANIIPGMRSLYWWQGRLEKGEEGIVYLAKPTADALGAAEGGTIRLGGIELAVAGVFDPV